MRDADRPLLLLAVVLSVAAPPALARADDDRTGEAPDPADEAPGLETVVTATRTERQTIDTPAAIEVADDDAVDSSSAWNIGAVLESMPGVQSLSRNAGYDTHIIIRGAGASAAYGVREIMVLVDGVPVTDPDSFTRLDVVDTALIERIEVLRGPNSTLYGANATGGVINVITKHGLGSQGPCARVGYGANDTLEAHGCYGGSIGERFWYFVGESYKRSSSWREHNQYQSLQLNLKLDYSLSDATSVAFLASVNGNDLELPGSLTEEEFEQDPAQVASEWPNMARQSRTLRTTVELRHDFRPAELEVQLYFQPWTQDHPVPFFINERTAYVYGAQAQLDVPHAFLGLENTLTVGLSGQIDDSRGKRYAYRDLVTEQEMRGPPPPVTVGVPPYSSSRARGRVAETTRGRVIGIGAYAQQSLRLRRRLFADFGVRLDGVFFDLSEDRQLEWDYGTHAYQAVADDGAEFRGSPSWWHVSPRVGISYRLLRSMSAYVSAGTGFQAPTDDEIIRSPDLEPQEVLNLEAGYKLRWADRVRADLAVFYAPLRNEIIPLMDEVGERYYANAGETIHRGVEVSGEVRLVAGLSVTGSYTFSDFAFVDFDEMEVQVTPVPGGPPRRDVVTHARDGNALPLSPRHQVAVSLVWRSPWGLTARLSQNAWSSYWADAANSESYEGFWVLDARLEYEWRTLGVFAEVRNLLDHKYAVEVSENYGAVRYTPGAPRLWNLGASWNF